MTMNNLLLTFGIAFAIVILSLLLLGISRVVTGKSRLKLGMCGRAPLKKRSSEEGCGKEKTCIICSRSDEEED